MREIILINQVTGPLFVDIANAYAKHCRVILFTGEISEASIDLSSNITVKKGITYKRIGAKNRIFTWMVFFIQSFWLLLTCQKKKEVLLVSNPPINMFLGILLNWRGIVYNLLVYDVYPDAIVEMGYLEESNLIIKLWRSLNALSYKHCHRLITISESMKQLISKSVFLDKIEVVYPWVDTTFVRPIPKSENWFVEMHGLTGKTVILYSGNLGGTHDFETLLDTAHELRNHPKFHFVIIGDGVKAAGLKLKANELALKNVSFLPFQEKEVLPFSIASADFGVVTLGAGAEGLSVPSKTYYQLAAGNAILAISQKGSELERIINSYKCGVLIRPGQSIKLAELLLNLSFDELIGMQKNARKASLHFSSENATKI